MNKRSAINSWGMYAGVAASLLGLVTAAAAKDPIRPLPVKQRMAHTCDRQHCYTAPINMAESQNAPTAQVMKVAPVGGQRISLALNGAPDCFATDVDLTSTSWDDGDYVTYLSQSSVPVPLGSTHTSLTYNATSFIDPSGSVPAAYEDAGNLYTLVRMRRSGSGDGDWWIATAAPSNPVSSELEDQYFWSNVSMSTLVDLSELPGGSGVPSGFDIEVRHYVSQDEGFADEALVCAGELLITL